MDNQRTSCTAPTPGFFGAEIVDVSFGGFADLPMSKGHDNFVDSPEFKCLDHQWFLRVYPGGHNDSKDGWVAVTLYHQDRRECIDVDCVLSIEKIEPSTTIGYKAHVYDSKSFLTFGPSTSFWRKSSIWSRPSFIERSVLMAKALRQGTLIIKVGMRTPAILFSPSKPERQLFVPENPIVANILKKFNDEKSADVVFEVSHKGDDKSEESTTFYAHSWCLQLGAPELFELSGSTSTILITDVKPTIFHQLLYYVYGGKVNAEDLESNARAFINAADKYNVVNLKLQAEASLVSTTKFTVDDVLEYLFYSYERNCELLKEKAMDFIVKNKAEVQNKVSFVNAPGYMITDVLAAVDRNDMTRIDSLRRRLAARKLDVGGSRETLVARLEEHA